ncbi:MAG: right-handed parallel beta-helix repeat-containing protein [Syntrophaceae bacterium]|nr:right-handed parallel beta-helix repeat-containing protein [Syntrophaceae bacterium]
MALTFFYSRTSFTKYFLFMLLCILFFPGISGSATYYVSSSSGKDSNSGISLQAPFKTLNRISALDLKPGDKVLLKKGDTWQESLTLPGTGNKNALLVFSSYGNGEMPVINGATLLKDWTKSVPGTYFTGYIGMCNGLLENGIPLKRASSKSLTDGQWFHNGVYIHYRPTKDLDVAYRVERCARGSLFTLENKEYVLIDGITFYGANKYGIRLIDCSNITIANCKIVCNGGEGIGLHRQKGELVCKNILIRNNILDWNANGIYIEGKKGGFKSTGYIKSMIINNSITHTNFRNVWEHSTKDGHAIGIQNSSFCRFEGNTITDNYSGIALWTAESFISQGNIFTRNFVARNQLYGIVNGADGRDNSFHNTFSFNIITENGWQTGNWGGLRINKPQTKGNYYYNNTLYNNDINIYLYSSPDFHVIKNNISLHPRKYHVWLDKSAGTHNIIDNNCYFSDENNLFLFRSSKDISFATWVSLSRSDQSSIFSDPLLKSSRPVDKKDFRLAEKSPCTSRAAKDHFDLQKNFFGLESKEMGACGIQ